MIRAQVAVIWATHCRGTVQPADCSPREMPLSICISLMLIRTSGNGAAQVNHCTWCVFENATRRQQTMSS